MFADLRPLEIAVLVVLFVCSLGVHEAAHAWMAKRCGDDTAYRMGRMTLNPLPHIDLVWTILMPAILLATHAGFLFGGAKPVPVVFGRLRHRWRDMALVALAGPASNVVLALLTFLLLKVFLATGLYTLDQRIDELLLACMGFNAGLAVFNMLPVPPLDGSRVMTWLLPASWRVGYQAIGAYGILIVLLLTQFVPAFNHALQWSWHQLMEGIMTTVSLGGLW